MVDKPDGDTGSENQGVGSTSNKMEPRPDPITPQTMPPFSSSALPQLAGSMLGITVGQPQQNPEVVQHICTYLSHDSDNRLKWFEARGKKSHVFRMTALIVVAVLSVLVLAIPLVALARGDMVFVKDFLDRYLTQIIMVALALLGGGKLFDLLK